MQTDYTTENQFLSAGKYLAALALIDKKLRSAPPEEAGSLQQHKAMYLSFCGDEAGALAAMDSPSGPTPGKVPPAEAIPSARLYEAREEILKQAAKHRVVILNEAHHVPRHRAFGGDLLEGLRRLGYTYFAAETFADPQTLQESLARRRVTRWTGYYTVEPVFAAYVQRALDLGFKPIAYEIEGAKRQGSAAERINERETAQANNLYERIFKKDPNAKVLVHVGYNHATRTPDVSEYEGKREEMIWMAGRLTKLLGFPLLTIDQTGGTESGSPAQESARLRGVLSRSDLRRPSLVRKADGSFLKEGIGEDCDLAVFHPRARLRQGRPDWIFHLPGRKAVALPASIASSKTGRLLVQAFAEGAPNDAVDIDRFLLTANVSRPVFVLPRGRYRLQVQDEEGNVSSAGMLAV